MTFRDWMKAEHGIEATDLTIDEAEEYYLTYLRLYGLDI